VDASFPTIATQDGANQTTRQEVTAAKTWEEIQQLAQLLSCK